MTIESFLSWKAKFESETVKKKVIRDPTKPTGKEMFLNNAALNESDIEFLTSGSINVFYQIFHSNLYFEFLKMLELTLFIKFYS